MFEAPDVSSLGAVAASALTHFFSHVAAVRYLDSKFHLLAGSMPQVIESLPFEGYVGQPEPFYGPETDHEAGALLRAWLGFEESLAILMVAGLWTMASCFLWALMERVKRFTAISMMSVGFSRKWKLH